MNISAYISELNRQYASGNATEHSYRPALKSLSETLLPDLTIINEPKRTACGAPDYILLRNDIPVAFIEAKDFTQTQDLAGQKENKEQFDRYKHSLDNIIFTDYLDFWLYEKGEFVDSVRLAEIKGGKIVAVEGRNEIRSHHRTLGQSRPAKNHVCETIGPNHGGKSETDGRRHRKGAAARR